MVTTPENAGIRRLAHHLLKNALVDLTQDSIKGEDVYEAERWIYGDGQGLVPITWICDALRVDIEFVRDIADRALNNPETLNAHMEDAYD